MFNLSLPITLSVNVLNVLFWVLAVAPSIVITCLITNKNRHLYFNVIAVFLCGAAAVFAAGRLELFIKSQWRPTTTAETIAYYFLVVGLVEELFKWGSYKAIVVRDGIEYRYEYVIYMVAAACGFAALENILYLRTMDISVAIVRAIVSVPCHAINCVVMGTIIGKSHHYKLSQRIKYNILGIAAAAFTHGLYVSIIVVTNSWSWVLGFEFIAIALAVSLIAYVKRTK